MSRPGFSPCNNVRRDLMAGLINSIQVSGTISHTKTTPPPVPNTYSRPAVVQTSNGSLNSPNYTRFVLASISPLAGLPSPLAANQFILGNTEPGCLSADNLVFGGGNAGDVGFGVGNVSYLEPSPAHSIANVLFGGFTGPDNNTPIYNTTDSQMGVGVGISFRRDPASGHLQWQWSGMMRGYSVTLPPTMPGYEEVLGPTAWADIDGMIGGGGTLTLSGSYTVPTDPHVYNPDAGSTYDYSDEVTLTIA